MAYYSPEMRAAMRHDYEDTDKPTRLIAAEYGISPSTLQTLVYRYGWARRSERVRGCPRETQLLQAAEALAATYTPLIPAQAGIQQSHLDADNCRPGSPLSRGRAVDFVGPAPPLADGSTHTGEVNATLSPAERLEALVVKEIAAEEAVRAHLQGEPRRRAEAERCARTLSILAQTLRSLQQQRCGRSTDDETIHDDDMPADIDEFRRALARRIEAFVASRADADDAGEAGGSASVGEV
jgi:hypothetical protein